MELKKNDLISIKHAKLVIKVNEVKWNNMKLGNQIYLCFCLCIICGVMISFIHCHIIVYSVIKWYNIQWLSDNFPNAHKR